MILPSCRIARSGNEKPTKDRRETRRRRDFRTYRISRSANHRGSTTHFQRYRRDYAEFDGPYSSSPVFYKAHFEYDGSTCNPRDKWARCIFGSSYHRRRIGSTFYHDSSPKVYESQREDAKMIYSELVHQLFLSLFDILRDTFGTLHVPATNYTRV